MKVEIGIDLDHHIPIVALLIPAYLSEKNDASQRRRSALLEGAGYNGQIRPPDPCRMVDSFRYLSGVHLGLTIRMGFILGTWAA